jgi:transcriptional regulator with XRE-family HTH domain
MFLHLSHASWVFATKILPMSRLLAPPESFGARFGRLVRRKRAERGWSQTDLARACGSSQMRLSRLETGRVPRPRHATLQALCRALGLPPVELDLLRAGADPSRPAPYLLASSAEPAAGAPALPALARLLAANDACAPAFRSALEEGSVENARRLLSARAERALETAAEAEAARAALAPGPEAAEAAARKAAAILAPLGPEARAERLLALAHALGGAGPFFLAAAVSLAASAGEGLAEAHPLAGQAAAFRAEAAEALFREAGEAGEASRAAALARKLAAPAARL